MLNRKKFPEDELIELFGDRSGELTSEKFHPGWFLLQYHHATTLDDLKAGLAYLRRKVHSQKEGQLSFLKVNTIFCKFKFTGESIQNNQDIPFSLINSKNKFPVCINLPMYLLITGKIN